MSDTVARPVRPIRLLLTVPHLESTVSPYREMMALARHLPRPEFALTICSLRENGRAEAEPILRSLGAKVFVSRFRPRGQQVSHLLSCLKDQRVISGMGPFDLQHSLDFSSAPIEAGLAKLWGRRFIFSQRNLNEGGHRLLLRAKCFLAKHIVVNSTAVGRFLESLGLPRERITKISLGIECDDVTDEMSGRSRSRERFVLSVGQIERRKRHEVAIEAFSSIASDLPDLQLWIAGRVYDQEYAASLKELASRRGLADRVRFLGVRSDVSTLMRDAECLLHCPESEAFGWVILEAMAAGLPVVASSVGGIPELLANGRTGVLVPPGDVQGFADAVRELLNSPERALSLRSEARRVVRELYSASVMVNRLANLYRNMSAANLLPSPSAAKPGEPCAY